MTNGKSNMGFSEEYLSVSQTASETKGVEKEESKQLKIETQRYGLTKPKRMIIRAKITK